MKKKRNLGSTFKLQNLTNFMKIREVLDKKVGEIEYKRYITTLPKDIVKESKLLGKELKARAEEDKIILEKA